MSSRFLPWKKIKRWICCWRSILFLKRDLAWFYKLPCKEYMQHDTNCWTTMWKAISVAYVRSDQFGILHGQKPDNLILTIVKGCFPEAVLWRSDLQSDGQEAPGQRSWMIINLYWPIYISSIDRLFPLWRGTSPLFPNKLFTKISIVNDLLCHLEYHFRPWMSEDKLPDGTRLVLTGFDEPCILVDHFRAQNFYAVMFGLSIRKENFILNSWDRHLTTIGGYPLKQGNWPFLYQTSSLFYRRTGSQSWINLSSYSNNCQDCWSATCYQKRYPQSIIRRVFFCTYRSKYRCIWFGQLKLCWSKFGCLSLTEVTGWHHLHPRCQHNNLRIRKFNSGKSRPSVAKTVFTIFGNHAQTVSSSSCCRNYKIELGRSDLWPSRGVRFSWSSKTALWFISAKRAWKADLVKRLYPKLNNHLMGWRVHQIPAHPVPTKLPPTGLFPVT